MDGVPYLTQCPVPFGESFRYSFYAADEGTHFYHSHAGHQKADGAYGALVVRGVKKSNPNRALYDHDMKEHTIVMADWMQQNAEDSMPGFAKRSSLSQSVLVNGHGRFFNVSFANWGSLSHSFSNWRSLRHLNEFLFFSKQQTHQPTRL